MCKMRFRDVEFSSSSGTLTHVLIGRCPWQGMVQWEEVTCHFMGPWGGLLNEGPGIPWSLSNTWKKQTLLYSPVLAKCLRAEVEVQRGHKVRPLWPCEYNIVMFCHGENSSGATQEAAVVAFLPGNPTLVEGHSILNMAPCYLFV